jgi:hypothetical protein
MHEIHAFRRERAATGLMVVAGSALQRLSAGLRRQRAKTPQFYRASPNLLTFTILYRERFYLSAEGKKCAT